MFTEGLVISNHDVLITLADEIELNKDEIKEVLANCEKYRYEVSTYVNSSKNEGPKCIEKINRV